MSTEKADVMCFSDALEGAAKLDSYINDLGRTVNVLNNHIGILSGSINSIKRDIDFLYAERTGQKKNIDDLYAIVNDLVNQRSRQAATIAAQQKTIDKLCVADM